MPQNLSTGTAMGDTPRLSRPVTLHFRADWGQANFHRICGWLAQEIGDRAPEGSRFATWNGRGGFDQIAALRAEECDITVVTPTAALSMLHQAGELKGLAALGVIPQRDKLVVAVDAALPVSTVADLASVDRPLTIATSPDDGVNTIGFAAHKGLRLAGLDVDRFSFFYHERPFPPIARFAAGKADVLIHEAIMTPHWQSIDRTRPVKYLPWGDTVLDAFEAEGWGRGVVPAGYLPGLENDLTTLEFSDFALLCREDLADDIAYLTTWCMIRTRQALEGQYAHIPADRSPVTYPLVPAAMARTPLPLHPAAERAYADVGDLALPEDDDTVIWKR
ncbi:TAXI family TRAP transporter solute-binding subunit [Streptomyces fulvoviolaceus]|uniref:TAXI family TRAP transporter solute-binding subunit n=1 Tax=Streptomyces fulvoviolaceus TaxID=285535 RepID=UPI000996CDCC|nr:TAXI family TRAP transporter solute-binding subunit [Streptomyces fulvoviolaceus]